MIRKFLILFLVLSSSGLYAQTDTLLPDGVYMNLDQLRNRTPQFNADFNITRRTQGDIGFNGGNDYEIKSPVDSMNKHFLKKEVYAYVKNDSFFLNGFQQQLGTWYAYCFTYGNFITFKGTTSNKAMSEQTGSSGFMFGAIGGAISAASAAKKRYLYVLSMRTGNVKFLDKEYLTMRLTDNSPQLLEQYSKEKEPESEETLIRYVRLLNAIVSPYSIAPKVQEEVK